MSSTSRRLGTAYTSKGLHRIKPSSGPSRNPRIRTGPDARAPETIPRVEPEVAGGQRRDVAVMVRERRLDRQRQRLLGEVAVRVLAEVTREQRRARAPGRARRAARASPPTPPTCPRWLRPRAPPSAAAARRAAPRDARRWARSARWAAATSGGSIVDHPAQSHLFGDRRAAARAPRCGAARRARVRAPARRRLARRRARRRASPSPASARAPR